MILWHDFKGRCSVSIPESHPRVIRNRVFDKAKESKVTGDALHPPAAGVRLYDYDSAITFTFHTTFAPAILPRSWHAYFDCSVQQAHGIRKGYWMRPHPTLFG